jgi:hypothetical protein
VLTSRRQESDAPILDTHVNRASLYESICKLGYREDAPGDRWVPCRAERWPRQPSTLPELQRR